MSDWVKIINDPQGSIFEIVIDRADKLNAMQLGMLMAIAESIHMAERTPGVRLVVIRAEGKSFCAGLDLMAMGGNADYMGENWADHPHHTVRTWQAQLNRIADSPLPSLALIHGHCLGIGTELALACDFRYAAPESSLSLEETRIGLIPDVGGTTRLTQLIGPGRAKELILTGRRIDAPTAERWGLVNQIIPQDNFSQAAQALADEINHCAPLAVAAAKRVIHGVMNAQEGMRLEASEQAPLFRSEDLQIGAQAAMLRQKPEWKWR
jgi:enoyl-CoA hydratase/carnithine racemase